MGGRIDWGGCMWRSRGGREGRYKGGREGRAKKQVRWECETEWFGF